MFLSRKTVEVGALALALTFAPALVQQASANTQSSTAQHVVAPAQLQKDVAAFAAARQTNIATLQKFFSSPRAEQEMKRAGVDYKLVQRAVPSLSSEELAKFASRAHTAQAKFAAGALTNQQLTYIIIALATAVIILVIVEA